MYDALLLFFQLPVNVYESVIDLVNGIATMLFVELSYTLATEEAERIGVDHVARMSSADTSGNSNGWLIINKYKSCCS